MNRLKFITSIYMLSILVMASCKKEDNPSITDITNIITKGTWRVTMYNDSGTDETLHFSGYSFTFASGTVSAVKSPTTVSGTYTTVNDSGKLKFILDFGSTSPFDEINEDWEILETTSSKIRLQHISGGGGGTDLLTFEKN